MELQELRDQIAKQWITIARLGGEWNAGYTEGINYALSLVDDYIFQNTNKTNKNNDFLKHAWLRKDWIKVDTKTDNNNPDKKCGGKDCPCGK